MNTYTHVRLGSRSRPFVSEGLKCPKNYDNYLGMLLQKYLTEVSKTACGQNQIFQTSKVSNFK